MKSFFSCLFLILIGAAVYGLVIKGIPGNPKPSDMMNITEYSLRDRARFILTQNLVERHTFVLTREQADMAAPDVGYYGGNWYILSPPGTSIIAIPFYILGLKFNLSLIFMFIMGDLFAIGNLIFIFLISRQILKLPYWDCILDGLIFGFSSTSLSYAYSLFQHHTTAFLILSGFYAVYQYKMHKTWGFLWGLYVWLAYAVIITLDYPNALLMLPVMVYFLLESLKFGKDDGKYKINLRLALVYSSIFFVGITFLHGYYNKTNFGGWTKISSSLAGYREGVQKDLDQGNLDEVNALVNQAQTKKAPTNFLKETLLVNSSNTLLLALDKGLLIFNPIFILGIAGIFAAFRKMDLEKATLIALAAVVLFLYSSWWDPNAGWAFGPRYLIPMMPILAIFVAYFLSVVRFKFISKIVAFVLISFSCAVSLLGAVTTNAVPPKVEAVPLHSKYGIPYSIDFLLNGKTTSFAFNYFLHNKFTLVDYFFIIYAFLMVIFIVVLFIIPIFEHDHI